MIYTLKDIRFILLIDNYYNYKTSQGNVKRHFSKTLSFNNYLYYFTRVFARTPIAVIIVSLISEDLFVFHYYYLYKYIPISCILYIYEIHTRIHGPFFFFCSTNVCIIYGLNTHFSSGYFLLTCYTRGRRPGAGTLRTLKYALVIHPRPLVP